MATNATIKQALADNNSMSGKKQKASIGTPAKKQTQSGNGSEIQKSAADLHDNLQNVDATSRRRDPVMSEIFINVCLKVNKTFWQVAFATIHPAARWLGGLATCFLFIVLMIYSPGAVADECKIVDPVNVKIGGATFKFPAFFSPSISQKSDSKKIPSKFTYEFGEGRHVYCQADNSAEIIAKGITFSSRSMKFVNDADNTKANLPVGLSVLIIKKIGENYKFRVLDKKPSVEALFTKDGSYQYLERPVVGEYSRYEMVEAHAGVKGTRIWAWCYSVADVDESQICRVTKHYPREKFIVSLDIHADAKTVYGAQISKDQWPFKFYSPEKWRALFTEIDQFLSAYSTTNK